MDFSEPRVIANTARVKAFTREKCAPDVARFAIALLELESPLFPGIFSRQLRDDPRVHVINGDAARLLENWSAGACALRPHLSGIPFSISKSKKASVAR